MWEYQGVLLIGGRSLRMGSPKSLLAHGSSNLAVFLCDLLTRVTGRSPMLLGEGPFEGPELARIPDREAGAGPLSAILGLYDALPHRSFLVLATDLYALNRDALTWLLEEVANTNRPVVWPRFPGRPFGEPLAAIYSPEARPILERRWAEGERSLRRVFDDQQRHEPLIPASFRLAFQGVNTPEELARLKTELA